MTIIDLKSEPEHLHQLAKWHHEEWSYLNPDLTLDERINEMSMYLTDDFVPSTYILKLNDALVGSAAIISHDMDSHPEISPWLASVYVAEEFRGRGFGAKLVMHVMQNAKENALQELHLFTPSKETFYSKLGWSTVSKEKYRGVEVTIMKFL